MNAMKKENLQVGVENNEMHVELMRSLGEEATNIATHENQMAGAGGASMNTSSATTTSSALGLATANAAKVAEGAAVEALPAAAPVRRSVANPLVLTGSTFSGGLPVRGPMAAIPPVIPPVPIPPYGIPPAVMQQILTTTPQGLPSSSSPLSVPPAGDAAQMSSAMNMGLSTVLKAPVSSFHVGQHPPENDRTSPGGSCSDAYTASIDPLTAEVELDKRRTRNQREQRRSLKITEQIENLGRILTANGVDVKANKYNILAKVSDYIRELQRKNASLQEGVRKEKTRRSNASSSTASSSGGENGHSTSSHTKSSKANSGQGKSEDNTTRGSSSSSSNASDSSSEVGTGDAKDNSESATSESASVSDKTGKTSPTNSSDQCTDKSNSDKKTTGQETSNSSSGSGSGSGSGSSPSDSPKSQEGSGSGDVSVSGDASSTSGGVTIKAEKNENDDGNKSPSSEKESENVSETDFRAVFQWCAMPWALARVDSRIFDCNESFVRVSGYTKAELLSSTIFNLIPTEDLQDTFSAVGALLTNEPVDESDNGFPGNDTESNTGSASGSKGNNSSSSIRRRAKINTTKAQALSYTFASTATSKPSKSSSHRKNTKSIEAKLSSQVQHNVPPLDIVMNLVRSTIDQRPCYFHVRLVPSKKVTMQQQLQIDATSAPTAMNSSNNNISSGAQVVRSGAPFAAYGGFNANNIVAGSAVNGLEQYPSQGLSASINAPARKQVQAQAQALQRVNSGLTVPRAITSANFNQAVPSAAVTAPTALASASNTASAAAGVATATATTSSHKRGQPVQPAIRNAKSQFIHSSRSPNNSPVPRARKAYDVGEGEDLNINITADPLPPAMYSGTSAGPTPTFQAQAASAQTSPRFQPSNLMNPNTFFYSQGRFPGMANNGMGGVNAAAVAAASLVGQAQAQAALLRSQQAAAAAAAAVQQQQGGGRATGFNSASSSSDNLQGLIAMSQQQQAQAWLNQNQCRTSAAGQFYGSSSALDNSSHFGVASANFSQYYPGPSDSSIQGGILQQASQSGGVQGMLGGFGSGNSLQAMARGNGNGGMGNGNSEFQNGSENFSSVMTAQGSYGAPHHTGGGASITSELTLANVARIPSAGVAAGMGMNFGSGIIGGVGNSNSVASLNRVGLSPMAAAALRRTHGYSAHPGIPQGAMEAPSQRRAAAFHMNNGGIRQMTDYLYSAQQTDNNTPTQPPFTSTSLAPASSMDNMLDEELLPERNSSIGDSAPSVTSINPAHLYNGGGDIFAVPGVPDISEAPDVVDVPSISNGGEENLAASTSDTATNNGSLANENRSYGFTEDAFDNSYNFFDDLMDVAPNENNMR